MVDLFTLRSKVKVKGVDSIQAYYYTSSSKQVDVHLYDINGTEIGQGTNINLNAGANDVSKDINDYISANESNMSVGVYVLKVGDYYQPIIFAEGGQTPDKENGLNPAYIVVMHTGTGTTISLPGDTPIVPLNGSSIDFITVQYYYDKSRRLGLVKSPSQDTMLSINSGWTRVSIQKLTVGFNSVEDMVRFMLRLSTGDNTLLELIGKALDDQLYDNIVYLLYMLSLPSIIGGYPIGYDIDINSKTITVEELIPLGFLDIDTSKIKKFAGYIAGTAAIVGAVVVGGPIGFILAATGIGILAYSYFNSGDSDYNVLKSRASQWKTVLAEKHAKALEDLEYLKNKYNISDQDYENIKSRIDDLYVTAVKAIDDIVDIASNWYNEGYSDARKKYLPIGAALGVIGDTIVRSRIGGRI